MKQASRSSKSRRVFLVSCGEVSGKFPCQRASRDIVNRGHTAMNSLAAIEARTGRLCWARYQPVTLSISTGSRGLSTFRRSSHTFHDRRRSFGHSTILIRLLEVATTISAATGMSTNAATVLSLVAGAQTIFPTRCGNENSELSRECCRPGFTLSPQVDGWPAKRSGARFLADFP